MTGGATPSGWYPNPDNPSQERWWDGTTWTDATRPSGGGAPPPPGAYPPPPGQYAPPPGAYGAPVGYGYAPTGAQLANFGQRLVAYIVDLIVVAVPVGIVTSAMAAASDALGAIGQLIGIVAGVAYFAYFEGGETGQTLGKKMMNIRVVDANTLQPGIGTGKAVGRYFSRILSSVICLLGYFWMLWDPAKQTWHDKIVATKVTVA